jgi:hypothetical protein
LLKNIIIDYVDLESVIERSGDREVIRVWVMVGTLLLLCSLASVLFSVQVVTRWCDGLLSWVWNGIFRLDSFDRSQLHQFCLPRCFGMMVKSRKLPCLQKDWMTIPSISRYESKLRHAWRQTIGDFTKSLFKFPLQFSQHTGQLFVFLGLTKIQFWWNALCFSNEFCFDWRWCNCTIGWRTCGMIQSNINNTGSCESLFENGDSCMSLISTKMILSRKYQFTYGIIIIEQTWSRVTSKISIWKLALERET